MVALGQTLIILTGGIDLSLGGIVALANVVCVMTMNTESPVGFILPLIAAVVLGLVCGALKRSAGNKRKSGSYYRNHCNNSNF